MWIECATKHQRGRATQTRRRRNRWQLIDHVAKIESESAHVSRRASEPNSDAIPRRARRLSRCNGAHASVLHKHRPQIHVAESIKRDRKIDRLRCEQTRLSQNGGASKAKPKRNIKSVAEPSVCQVKRNSRKAHFSGRSCRAVCKCNANKRRVELPHAIDQYRPLESSNKNREKISG